MKSCVILLLVFGGFFRVNQAKAQQVATEINFGSILGGPDPNIPVYIRTVEGNTVVPEGTVSIRLCSFQYPDSCFDSCSANVDAGGDASCHLNVNVPPGEYMLETDYYDTGGTYEHSETRQPVAGDEGGGISPV